MNLRGTMPICALGDGLVPSRRAPARAFENAAAFSHHGDRPAEPEAGGQGTYRREAPRSP